MGKLIKISKPGRSEVIKVIKDEALEEGKATGIYTDDTTGLKERFTYIKKHGRIELAEIWTNAEEIYPPFTDKKGRRIRY